MSTSHFKFLSLLNCLMVCAVAQGRDDARGGLTFERDVAPVLDKYCIRCHGGEVVESGLDLRRRFSIEKGGDSGTALVRGDAEASLLIEVIEAGQMPPEDQPRPSPEAIGLLRRWVQAGAATVAIKESPLPSAPKVDVYEKARREHWAFQPIHGRPPTHTDYRGVQSPIDAFIRRELDSRRWAPAPRASRRKWLRRVTFDLIGLPPTPEEIEAFENDPSPDAFHRVVDRLLASPHYGERWAQHWLDVVRFAETEGFEYDRHLPDAWRFRDYVIQSLNADKPFDQFVTEQIAGDELSPGSYEAAAAAIFHRLGAVRRNAGNPDIALSRNEVLTERTNIVGEAFLGLTVGCARCHNHKLEPISQKDYYRLQAYFAASVEDDQSLAPEAARHAWEQQTDKINSQIKSLKKQLEPATDDKMKAELESEIKLLEASLPAGLPTIPTIRNDFKNRTEIHVLRRGVWELKGVVVRPRPLSVLVGADVPELPMDALHPRTQLARWITSHENPLTARVFANRLWQYHFGVGLVKTANDFGTHGDPPSHPQLLDWLAGQLIHNQWRIKPLHRALVLSQTYRQSSIHPDAARYAASDPENRLLWRWPRRRLSAEEIRDAMLSASGRLMRKAEGPSVMVPVDSELIDLLYKPAQWQIHASLAEHHRRSVYLIAKRNLRLPFMEVFDAPARQSSCAKREISTHAPQALEMLNGRLTNGLARPFAERLLRDCGEDREAVVRRAYAIALGRKPNARELRLTTAYLSDQPLREFALAMFNLSDFVYLD